MKSKMKFRINFLIILASLFTNSNMAFSQNNAKSLYKTTVKSIVKINTYDDNGPLKIGSGFFIDSNLIVTNYHVIEGAKTVSFELSDLDGNFAIDGYVAIDKINDLVILKTNKIKRPYLKFYNKNIEIGEKIYVIGNPKGFEFTLSDGLISQYRNFDGLQLLQLTAPISSGSSGGPILSEFGLVIGVAVAQMVEGQNLNFAIPNYQVKSLNNIRGDKTIAFSTQNETDNTLAKIEEPNIPNKEDKNKGDKINVCGKNYFLSQEIINYVNNGTVLYSKNDYEGCIRNYDMLLSKYPDYCVGYYNRGLAKMLIGEIDAACADWVQCKNLGLESVQELINKYCKK